jgi:cytoskeleton protein RodZ
VPPAQPATQPTPAAPQTVPAAAPEVVAAATPTSVSAALPPASPEQGKVFGAINGPSRITLRAAKDAWIEVRDRATEKVVAQRTLHAGDAYRVPDRQGLSLRTGNGSGLDITVDGKPAPSLGGTIRRNVALDPDRLLAGSALDN